MRHSTSRFRSRLRLSFGIRIGISEYGHLPDYCHNMRASGIEAHTLEEPSSSNPKLPFTHPKGNIHPLQTHQKWNPYFQNHQKFHCSLPKIPTRVALSYDLHVRISEQGTILPQYGLFRRGFLYEPLSTNSGSVVRTLGFWF